MQAENLLIQKIASRPSTEELLFFIAEDEAITSACSSLQKKIAGSNKKELAKINALCQKYHISLVYLSRELSHIQNVFAPRETISNEHKLLGLQAGASIAKVKQAYRRLSIKYHPDTSTEKNTAKFIEITKAYQRIITSTDNKKGSAAPSSSAWRYRKNTPPPPQQRKKKYLYLFLLVAAALVLVIVRISVHYQKNIMLNNISKKNQAPTQQTFPAVETAIAVKEQPAAHQVYKEHKAHPLVSSKVELKKLEKEEAPDPAVSARATKNLSSQHSSQEEIPAVRVKSKSMALIQPPQVQPTQVQPTAPDGTAEVAVENLSTPASFSYSHFESEKNNEKSSVQEPNQEEAKSIMPVEEQSEFFSDIFKQENPAGETMKAATPAATVVVKQTSNQKKISSVFPEKRYRKAVIVKPKERKIRKKKSAVANNDQKHQDLSPQDSLRQFVKNYTTAYMSRDIRKLARFFTKGALENGKPFSEMHKKYTQLFNATQSIDYRIDILNTDIQKKGTTATLTGRLHVRLIYSPDKVKSNTGTLTFFLIKDNKSYKVKALTYTIDPQW
ncbi:DnaJ domain-containing protein [Candidatus Electrothrix aarhusensis]